jgi:N-methylhydantoinase A
MNLGVDIGGTFTDLVGFDPHKGELVVSKALNLGQGPRADLMTAVDSAEVSADQVEELTHGTTKVTNLLIERAGAKVGLVCTRGFRDVLEIQLSYRKKPFDLFYVKTPALVPRHLRLEIGGRIDARGEEVEPVDPAEVRQTIEALLAEGIEVLAVALYNSYANPDHERQVEEIAEKMVVQVPVTLSTSVVPRIGEYQRASTTVLNAMAVPAMQAYVDDLEPAVGAPILYMHSGAGVMPGSEARIRPIFLAFSGPAAGVLAGREVARQLGFPNAITMDIGGTSCDICLIWDNELRYRDEIDVEWGIPARIQSLDLHTIGAGGGSICWQDTGGALRVGPRSAGAVPGPACYGRGGVEPTITDANLVLGILSAEGLLAGRLPLQSLAAREAFEQLGARFEVSAEEAAKGAYSIVNANMAQAIRQLTVQQGIDPRLCALTAFGGAGAQHAVAVAEQLGVKQVVIPAHGSVLSALGLLSADVRLTSVRTLLVPLEELESDRVRTVYQELQDDAVRRLGAPAGAELVSERFVGLRYVGQSHMVPVSRVGDAQTVAARFEDEHERLFGTRLGDPVEVVDCWVTVTQLRPQSAEMWSKLSEDAARPAGMKQRRVALEGVEVPIFWRGGFEAEVQGPCLIEEAHSVTYVPAGATVRQEATHLVIELA